MRIFALVETFTNVETIQSHPHVNYLKFFQTEHGAEKYLDEVLKERFKSARLVDRETLRDFADTVCEGLDGDAYDQINEGPWAKEEQVFLLCRDVRQARLERWCCAEGYLFEIQEIEVHE